MHIRRGEEFSLRVVNELTPVEAGRMRDKLTRVNASIGATVGMDLWNETQAELARIRGVKK